MWWRRRWWKPDRPFGGRRHDFGAACYHWVGSGSNSFGSGERVACQPWRCCADSDVPGIGTEPVPGVSRLYDVVHGVDGRVYSRRLHGGQLQRAALHLSVSRVALYHWRTSGQRSGQSRPSDVCVFVVGNHAHVYCLRQCRPGPGVWTRRCQTTGASISQDPLYVGRRTGVSMGTC